MNEIEVLRNKVAKLVNILSEKQLRVTQRGDSAYVLYDNDQRPYLVNVPNVPENAPEELLVAIEGFLDHEVGHVLFTDPQMLATAKLTGHASLFNMVEDVRVERKMREKFAGSAKNVDDAGRYVIRKVIDKWTSKALNEGTPLDSVLIGCAIRAWSGHGVFADYMKDKWHLIPELESRIGEYCRETLKNIDTSKDALEVAEELKRRLCESQNSQGGQGQGNQRGQGDQQDGEQGQNNQQGDQNSQDDQNGQGDQDNQQSDRQGLAGAFGRKGDEDDPEEEEKGRQQGDRDGDRKEDEEGKADKSESSGENENENDQNSDSSGNGDSGDSGDDSKNDGDTNSQANANNGNDSCGDDVSEALKSDLERDEMQDFSEMLADSITRENRKAPTSIEEQEYRVYTTEFDKIAPPVVRDRIRATMALGDITKKTQGVAGVLQKKMERLVSAKSLATWTAGHRSGRLNAGALSRLVAFNDEAVFKRKHTSMTKDVAVSLLIDCSGSMNGYKIRTAIQSAYAFASVLGRMGIPFEMLGFTTGEDVRRLLCLNLNDPSAECTLDNYLQSVGHGKTRLSSLRIYVLKEFKKRFGYNEKLGMASMTYSGQKNNNVDGESVMIAVKRLMKQKAARRILMVLSDGKPTVVGARWVGEKHLKNTIEKVGKMGVECIAIGINSDAVKEFYPKYVVLRNVSELPTRVIGELETLLLAK